MPVRHLYLVAAAAIVGCAPAGGTSRASDPLAVPRSSNILTADEIATFHSDVPTAFDVVRRLRPHWMVARGVKSRVEDDGTEYALVFVDGHRYGILESLRNIDARQAIDIRFFNIAQAGAKFGSMGGTSGVIEVRMKTRAP